MVDLIKIDVVTPEIPKEWNYEESVNKVKRFVYKAKNLKEEILKELSIARKILSLKVSEQPRSSVGTFIPTDKNWDTYCEDIGSSRQVVNRWLNPKSIAHIAQSTGETEWDTPSEFIQSARMVMGNIDIDPASNEQANERIQADIFYTAKNDGLDKSWSGNIWMNPPYAQPLVVEFCEALIKKYESSEIKQACVLVNNATETTWFQGLLRICKCVCFLKGRIKFIDKKGNPSGTPLQGQAILYFGKKENEFAMEFSKFGLILWRK